MEDPITPRPQKIPFAKKKAKNMILKVLLVFMVVAAAALCPREVPSAGNLCTAIDESSFACGVLYTGTSTQGEVTCSITHSINVTCSAAVRSGVYDDR